MAKSRYYNSPIVDDHLGTRTIPKLDKTKIPYFQYKVVLGDRLDKLAHHFYGDDKLWWIIAYFNDIGFFFNLEPNTILYIPNNFQDIINAL